MKKLVLIIALLAVALPSAQAQNNPYSIDDVCFEYFRMTESLVEDITNDAFDIANDALLRRAQEVGDQKARTLYWVERLKRACRVARPMEDRPVANAMVDKAREEVIAVARETGYSQYLYYAYELSENYYVNTRQEVKAQNLLQEMMDVASRDEDEYGLWQSQRYLAILYQRQNDLLNARKYLRKVIDTYTTTSSDLIRRQGLTRQCCDMGDTYLHATDSARYYYHMAGKYARTHGDTVRFYYCNAKLAALDKQQREYSSYRDYCLNDPNFPAMVLGGEPFFKCADAIIAGETLEEIAPKANLVPRRQQMLYLRDIAIAYGREDLSAWLGTKIILTLYRDISFLNDMKMEEISVLMDSSGMNAVLAREKRLITILWVVVGLLAAALIAEGVYLVSKTMKKNHNQ